MYEEEFKTGGDCDAWCSRCEMDLAHTIVAMVKGMPVQTKCNTCGAFHKYRAPKSAAAKKKAPARKRAAASGTKKTGTTGAKRGSAASWEKNWQEQMEQAANAYIHDYRMTETYEKGGVIQHKRFGIGVVQDTPEAQKVVILFRTGPKTLVMGRG